MKKLIVLFVFVLGFVTFSYSSTLNDDKVIIENCEDIIKDSKVDNFEFSFDDIEVCSGTLTYLGFPIATFVGFGNTMSEACENARQQARDYVLSLGDDPGF